MKRNTEFYMDAANLEKWMHQNEANFTMQVDGVLLDNYFIGCKRGFAFVYESYVNCWTSRYKVVFVPYQSGNRPEYDKAFREWFDFVEKAKAAI